MLRIPVYIINRNRLTTTSYLTEWLIKIGEVEKVVILDNGSTYPPLLDWYNSPLPTNVQIIRMLDNGGHQVFWQHEMEKHSSRPYIVTDSDLVPASYCPTNLITKMIDYSAFYGKMGFKKIGPGIRIDNLPDSPWKKIQYDANQTHFRNRFNSESFITDIDTTFAIYRDGYGGTSPALRLDYPYHFEHVPWYQWPMDDEEIYYLQHANESSTFKQHVMNLCPDVLKKEIKFEVKNV